MPIGTQNNIRVKASPSGSVVYTVRTTRNSDNFALTDPGDLAMNNAIKAGTYPYPLTVEDTGVIIPANTIPPTTKPNAPALLAPTGLSATATSSSAINISWGAVSGSTGYEVERSANGTSGWSQVATPAGTSYSNTGLSANTSYYYRVRAVNGSGVSGYSSSANATTNTGSYPAYNQTQTYTGDNFVHPDLGSGATTQSMSFTDAPKADTNYNFSMIVYTTGVSGTGQGGIKVGSGSRQVTFSTEAADGGTRTLTGTLSLAAGNNTIVFEHVSGIWYKITSFTLTRAAGA